MYKKHVYSATSHSQTLPEQEEKTRNKERKGVVVSICNYNPSWGKIALKEGGSSI